MPAPKLDIKFSRKTRALSKYDVTFQQVVFAHLISSGFSKAEAAWAAYYKFDKTVTNAQCEQMAKVKMEVQGVKALIDHFGNASNADSQATQSIDALIAQKLNESGEMDKESTAMEILRIAQSLPDGKEKADLMMKYADIKGYKKADVQETDSRHTMFYLPATCDKCPVHKWVKENHPEALKSRKPKNV